MSVTVGRPNVSSTNSRRPQRAQQPSRCRSASRTSAAGRGDDPPHHRVRLRVHAGAVQRVVAAADPQEARALLERLRAEPRHLLAAPLRVRNGPLRVAVRARCSRPARRRCRTPATAAARTRCSRRRRRAFTQSSTTASSERDSFGSDRSCWYWPTPIDFGSIFTSSASGSCRRRAMDTAPRSDTSMLGQFLRGVRRGRVHRRARLGHHHLGQLQLRVPADQLGGELVGLPGRGAVADRDQLDPVRARPAAPAWPATRPTVLRLVRVDRVGGHHLAGGVHHRDLHAGPEARVQAHRRRGRRPARPAAGRAGWRRTPGPPRPRRPAAAGSAGPRRAGPGSGSARPSGRCPPATGRAGRPRSAMPNRAAIRALVVGAGRGRVRRRSGLDGEVEHLLLLAAEHRQDPVRRQLGERLGEVEVVGELGARRPPCRPGPRRPAGRGSTSARAARRSGRRPRRTARPGSPGRRPARLPRRRRPARRPRKRRRRPAGRASGRRAARRPAAPGRPRGRSAPWSGASACTAGRCPPAGPWSRRPGSAPRSASSSLPCAAIDSRTAARRSSSSRR